MKKIERKRYWRFKMPDATQWTSPPVFIITNTLISHISDVGLSIEALFSGINDKQSVQTGIVVIQLL